jgi:hypothetical protein
LESTEPAFKELTNSCIKRNLPVKAWSSAEALAMEERGDGLRIFDINHQKAPSLAEITLKLTDAEDDYNPSMNVVNWISDGIKAQNNQWVLYSIFNMVFF